MNGDGSQARILQNAVEEAFRLLGADGALIALVDETGAGVRFGHAAGLDESQERAWKAALRDPRERGGLVRRALEDRRVRVTDDYLADVTFPKPRDAARLAARLGLRSFVVAPLLGPGGPLGVLGVSSRQPAAFDEAQVALVRVLADHAAAALVNAQLISQLDASRLDLARRAERERALRELSADLVAIRDPRELLQRVVEDASRLVAADGAILALLDRERGELSWSFDDGLSALFDPGYVAALTLPIGVGVTGKAIAENRSIAVGDDLINRFPRSPESDHFFDVTGFQSMIGVPIVGEDGPLGALEVYARREGAFADEDVSLIETLAGQAAVTMTSARLIDELRGSRERLARRAEVEASLREIAGRLTAMHDPGAVLQRTLDEAVRLLDSDGGRIALIDEVSGDFYWAYASGLPALAEEDRAGGNIVRREGGISGRAMADRRAFFTDDYLADERFAHGGAADDFVTRAGIRSAIAAPIVSEAGPVGAINVHAFRPGAYDESAAELLDALASQAAVAVANARLIRELGESRSIIAQRADAQAALREIGARLTTVHDPAELLELVALEANRLLGADRTQIDLLDPETGMLNWAHVVGGDPGIVDAPLEPTAGAAGQAIISRRPFVTGNYLADDRFRHTAGADEFMRRTGLRSLIAAALFNDDEVLGALNVASMRPDAFSRDDVALIEALASQASVAITNARLIDELRRSREELARRADTERSLREITAHLASYREPTELLQHAVESARRLLGADLGLLDLIDPSTATIRWTHDSGISDPEIRQLLRDLVIPVGSGLFGAAVVRREVVATSDYMADESFTHTPGADEVVRRSGCPVVVAAPLIGESGVLGVLGLFSSRPVAFSEAEMALLAAFADAAAVAITNANLIEQLDRSRTELARRAETERTLREIAARITSLRDQRQVLQQIVDESKRLLESDGAHLALMAEDGGGLVPLVMAGSASDEDAAWLTSIRIPVGSGINGLAAELNMAVSTIDYLVDPRIPHGASDQEAAVRLGLRAMAAAPLRATEGEVIGTLAISYELPREIPDESLQLLQGLADHAAIAVTNLRLYERLAHSEVRYRHLVQNSPDLVWSIDADARFTFVSDTCERLTGWTPGELIGRHFGALVHPGSGEVATRDWTRGLDETRELRGRLSLLHRDGHAIPAEFIALARVEEGMFAGANGSVRDMTERDRLERELAASEARYRFLVEHSPDIIFSTDADGRYTYYSETVERLAGWKPDELIGRYFGEIVDLETFQDADRHWQAFIDEPSRLQIHRFSLRCANGDRLPVEVSAMAILDGDGRFAGVHGAARDVRERERLERELRESEARLREIIETTPDLIWETDADGVFTFVSATLRAMIGVEPEEVIGRHFDNVLHDSTRSEAYARWADLLAEPNEVHGSHFALRHRDGNPVPIENYSIGRVENGRFIGAHGSARDVSERDRLERQLRESEERYRYLVENSPDIVYETDETGTFTFISDTMERVLGWPPAALVGWHFSRVVSPGTLPAAAARWDAIVADPATVQTFELELLRPDGTAVPFEITAIGTIRNGVFAGVHGSSRDISERQRLERELRTQAAALAASEERAHLARELHDSVTQGLFSMTLLTRSIELLLDRDRAAAAEKLRTLRELQRDALAETRALIFELRPSSLAEEGLIKALRTHTAAVQGRIGLPVIIEADPIGRLPIEAEDALYRISQEALHNVVKHANARQVWIEIRAVDGGIRLLVEDDGVGFDEATVPSGHLGLAGMRARAEKIGGRLVVRSRAGGGTTIDVSIPNAALPDQVDLATSPDAVPPNDAAARSSASVAIADIPVAAGEP